ncbi:hypothetical protein [Gordonia malaquae]|uniref:hypothetical protein n=1 Tax=Gordonia malaquae TaxID=410332 RepID=UPI0030FED27C
MTYPNPYFQPPVAPPGPPTVAIRRSVLLLLSIVVVAGTAAGAGLIGYSIGKGRSDDTVVAATTSTHTNSDSSPSTEESTVPSVDRKPMGEAATNGSAGVTLNRVMSPATIDFYDSDFVAKKPRAGTRFVLVALKVANNGQKPMSPLYVIDARLTDDRGREFSVVEDNGLMRENFSRNLSDELPDDLQPGLSAEVYYAFEVPLEADIVAFGFRDDAAEYDAPWTEYTVAIR